MATVYLATDLRHERSVALKVVQPDLAATLGGERFLREIRTTAQLSHPHILPLLDSGEAAGTLFYVMPYVEGESLRDRLSREGQLPVEEAVRIVREVADALAYAHGHGVVHRDIKPDNILLASGHAVVADFGIARAIHQAGSERLTATGMALGSPLYMSPEQASGVAEVDGRADVYSLGCVLYEALAGAPPFTGPTAESVARQHIAVDPHPVTALRPAVAPALAAAVHRSLAKVPADRFQSAQEFAAALAGGAGTAQVVASQAGAPRARRLRRLAVPVAGAAVVALAALAVVLRPWASRTPAGDGAASRVMVLPYDNETGDPALEPVGRMTAEWITEGLAQTGLVQVVPNLMVVQELAARPSDRAGPDRLHDLARTMKAGLAVTGSYYSEGDSLEFHSSVVDLGTGDPLGVVPAVRAPRRDASVAIEQVRSAVMGVLATRLNALSGWELPASVRPPSYQAALAYNAGNQDWLAGKYAMAAEEFRRAYGLDTTFLRAAMMAASAYSAAGDGARSDSLRRLVAARKDRLAPYDRLRLEAGEALGAGDREGALRALRAATALVPIGTARLFLAATLLTAGRPHEAAAHLDTLMHSTFAEAGSSWFPAVQLRAQVLHVLGRHEQELRLADSAAARRPRSVAVMGMRGDALAALGRVDEVRALADEVLASPPQRRVTPADVLLGLALELRAHGHRDASRDLAGRALAWLDAQSDSVRSAPGGRVLRERLLYSAERWSDAARVVGTLAGDSALSLEYLGMSGVLAARRGAPDSARGFAARLARAEAGGEPWTPTAWRAEIAAVLGEREQAVALLRQAFSQGMEFGMTLHADMDLESLRGYPPFEALLHPKE